MDGSEIMLFLQNTDRRCFDDNSGLIFSFLMKTCCGLITSTVFDLFSALCAKLFQSDGKFFK